MPFETPNKLSILNYPSNQASTNPKVNEVSALRTMTL